MRMKKKKEQRKITS